VASDAAHTPRIGMSAYGASKAALKSLALTVGLELAGSGVRCNLVSPGSTDTDMQRGMWQSDDAEQQRIRGFGEQFKLGIPLGKIAKPQEIANTVLFLASDCASHITLQDIVVDGGSTLGA
jgi:Dehydrogenases with different specificities (related to short-chain alcohol dehydrogenases)